MNRIQLPSNVVPDHYDLFVSPALEQLRFFCTVRIKVDVREPTPEIVLNAVELQLQHAVLDAYEVADIIVNQHEQTATLKFNNAIERGSHALSIDYAGRINQSAQGLFVSQYETPKGRERLLVTQFEAGDARR
jgi:aminopeptidase N